MSKSEKDKLLPDPDSSYEVEPGYGDQEFMKEYKPSELISQIGFGKAQLIAMGVVGVAFVSGFCAVQLQPFLSARLYVEMQLTPNQESLLSFCSLLGLIVSSFPFGYLCDKIGRKRTIILAVILMLVWNLLTCACKNFAWIAVFRFLVAISRGR